MVKLFEEFRADNLDRKIVEKFSTMLENMFPGRFEIYYEDLHEQKNPFFSASAVKCSIVESKFKIIFYLASRIFTIYGEGILQDYIKSKITEIFPRNDFYETNEYNEGQFKLDITQKELNSFELSKEDFEIFEDTERFGLW